jgi:hypothetical protein
MGHGQTEGSQLLQQSTMCLLVRICSPVTQAAGPPEGVQELVQHRKLTACCLRLLLLLLPILLVL